MLVAPIGWIPETGLFGEVIEPEPPVIPPITPTPEVIGGPAGMDAYGSWLWPANVYPESYTLLPQSFTMTSESPLTRTRRHVQLLGDRWVLDLTYRHTRTHNQLVEALLARLKGPVGIVALWDFDRETPLGSCRDWRSIGVTYFDDDTTFTDGTGFGASTKIGYTVYGDWPRGAEEIKIVGFPQYTTQLIGGDQIGINGRLYRLARDATSDGYGIARVYLHRGLLSAVGHDTTVVTTRPTSPFSLVDDDQGARSRSALGLPTITLRFVEDLTEL
jgi:hypothetical protein